MKKIFLMLGILTFGLLMILMVTRDSLISTSDRAIQSALEQNVEVSLNKNMDSSTRVTNSEDVYVNIDEFEMDMIYAFINNSNISIDIEATNFKFEYFVIQDGKERILPTTIENIKINDKSLDFTPKRSAGLKDSEILKGTIVSIETKGKTFSVRHIVDIRD